MPRWKEGSKDYTVAVNHHDTRGYQCNIPTPVMQLLGEPGKVTFKIRGKTIEIESAD